MDATPFSRTRASYLISSDSSLLSVPTIFTFMEDPQWKHRKNYTPKTLQTLLSHSFCLGLYKVSISGKSSEFKQIGFTRLITDHVSFAIVADVYVIEGERGQGLGKWLLECADEVVSRMSGLRRIILFCNEDSHEDFYGRSMGVKRWGAGAEKGVLMMHREGPGSSCRSDIS